MRDLAAFRQQSDDRPMHVAKRIVRAYGFKALPIPVEDILTDLGVRVERRPAPGWDGALDSRGTPPIVWISASERETRQRFAMAHELGHLLMHPPDLYRDATFAPGDDRRERDANDFALELLIPLWMLEMIVTSRRMTTSQASAMFNVSPGAMGCQLEKLL